MTEQEKSPLLPKGDKETIQLARELKIVMQTEGWKLYERLIRAHLVMKQREALTPCKTLDEAMWANANKGAVYALSLCVDLPHGIIRAADDIVARRKPDENLE